jgi:DNA (cytosine-5)-methyltransferase 1
MNAQDADINGKYTVISLFAGCGGSSLGYKLAGYKELLAIDSNKNAVETFKLNFPEVPIWQRNIAKIKGQEILDFCNTKKGDLDVLDGSPPCQGFSTAGKRKVADSRNDLVNEYIRLVSETEPKIFIMENVSGMVKGKMKGLFIEYVKKMKELNYNVRVKLLNAKYYDVPQSRQRLIFMGVRKDLKFLPIFPIPNKKLISVREVLPSILATRSQKINPLIDGRKPAATICASCEGYEIIRNEDWELEAAAKVRDTWIGEELKNIREGGQSKKHFSLVRAARNRPCPTIQKCYGDAGTAGLCHYSEDRRFTISELKRLQSFPDNFNFIGTFRKQWALIGNSVPPLFMKAISKTIRKEILEKI